MSGPEQAARRSWGSLPIGRDVLDTGRDRRGARRQAHLITGTTGFLGTALVERLLRCVPDCELVLLVRAGKRSPAAARASSARSSRTTPSTASAPSSATDALRRDGGPPASRRRRRRRHRRPRPRRRRPGRSWPAATSSSTRPPRCPSTRRSTRPSRSTCSARPASPSRLNDLGVTPHLVAVSTCYVAGNRRGTAPEELRQRRARSPSTSTGRPRSPPPAGRAATPRPPAASPDKLAEFRGRRPRRARRRRRARRSPPRPSSSASAGCATAWSRPAGPAPPALGWPDAYAYTKALGEQALVELQGDVPGQHRAPVDHRVGAGRAPSGLDPRLPHGRAGASSPTPAAC